MSDTTPPESAAPLPGPAALDAPLTIETAWVRERLRAPDVERLLSEPRGANIARNFEPLRVRVARAVERIAEVSAAAGEEVRARGRTLGLGALVSAALGIAAFVIAWTVPAWQVPATIAAFAEMAMLIVLRMRQRGLARDLFALHDLEVRFRDELESALTPEDLHRLTERILRELAIARGEAEIPDGKTV